MTDSISITVTVDTSEAVAAIDELSSKLDELAAKAAAVGVVTPEADAAAATEAVEVNVSIGADGTGWLELDGEAPDSVIDPQLVGSLGTVTVSPAQDNPANACLYVTGESPNSSVMVSYTRSTLAAAEPEPPAATVADHDQPTDDVAPVVDHADAPVDEPSAAPVVVDEPAPISEQTPADQAPAAEQTQPAADTDHIA
jgi:hypothetical protein